MSATTVRIELRNAVLAPAANLISAVPAPGATEDSDAVFVETDHPPPFGSIVRVVDGPQDTDARMLRVTAVAEIAEAGPQGARGCYGTFLDAEAVPATDRLGSEHLAAPSEHASEPTSEGGESDASPTEATGTAGDRANDAVSAEAPASDAPPPGGEVDYAVPAPVVEPEPSEPISTREAEVAAAAPTPNEPAAEPAPAKKGTKRRKGRKRK